MPRDRFETTFGELMARQGVKRASAPTPSRPPEPARPTGRPGAVPAPAVDVRQENTHRAELQQLLEAVHELRQQRDDLRQQLARQEKQLEQHISEKADMRLRMRRMEELRHEDMALITRLRRENTALTEASTALTGQRDKLQHALHSLQQRQEPPAAPPAPAPAPDTAASEDAADEGSDLQRAAQVLAAACRAAGVQRLVVVGGSPTYRLQLRELLERFALELRLVAGQERRTQKQARADLAWGDVVLVWGGTLLDHSLSQLYQGPTVRVISHRGLAGMMRLAAEGLEPRPA